LRIAVEDGLDRPPALHGEWADAGLESELKALLAFRVPGARELRPGAGALAIFPACEDSPDDPGGDPGQSYRAEKTAAAHAAPLHGVEQRIHAGKPVGRVGGETAQEHAPQPGGNRSAVAARFHLLRKDGGVQLAQGSADERATPVQPFVE